MSRVLRNRRAVAQNNAPPSRPFFTREFCKSRPELNVSTLTTEASRSPSPAPRHATAPSTPLSNGSAAAALVAAAVAAAASAVTTLPALPQSRKLSVLAISFRWGRHGDSHARGAQGAAGGGRRAAGSGQDVAARGVHYKSHSLLFFAPFFARQPLS